MRASGGLRVIQQGWVACGIKDRSKEYVGEGDNDRPEDSETSDDLPALSIPITRS